MKHFLALITFLLFGAQIMAQTVYTTKTGEKYHTENCRYLKHSKKAVSLEKAIELGYQPCSICKPSAIKESKASIGNNLTNSSTNSSSGKKSTATQCTGKTKEGKRCKRMTKNSSGRCYQHE